VIRTIAVLAFLALPAFADVKRVYVLDRTDVLSGKPFGKAGPYERIVAKAHFAVNPKAPANSTIRDLALAPRNAAGMVEFSADTTVRLRSPARCLTLDASTTYVPIRDFSI
jgi:hypothetical protein